MSLLKYIASAAAVAQIAYAQSSSNVCSQATATVQNGGDAMALATACPTFSGSISVATGTTGSLDFSGIQTITGSLIASGASNLSSVTSTTLSNIEGALTMTGLTTVGALTFPNLTSVGSLNFQVLGPGLQVLGWTTGLRNVGDLNIQDTFLQNLNGINLTSASSLTIANNQYLTDIDIPLSSISGQISLNANAAGKTMASFGNLTSAGAISISNCSSVYLGALQNVSNTAAFTGNGFTNLSLPQLSSSQGLIINNNNDMTSLNLPAYTTCNGALSVQNNTGFTGNVDLPALTHVTGAATFVGSFSNLTLPELNTVAGQMVIASNNLPNSVCNQYQAISGASSVIQGGTTCTGGKSTSSGSSSSGSSGSSSSTATSSSSSSTASHKSGASDIAATPTFTLLGALAAFFAVMA